MKLVNFIFRVINSLRLRLVNPSLRQSFSIKSHLTIPERVTLSKLARGKKIVCEIGSYIGASASAMGTSLVGADGAVLFCVDTWNNDAMSEGERDTYEAFLRNTTAVSECIVPVRGYSTDVVSQISSQVEHLDLLFIDGDHSYEGVKADWDAYKHLLRPGTTVAFHDFGWAEGVQRLITEEVMPVATDASSLPNLFWCTIKEKD